MSSAATRWLKSGLLCLALLLPMAQAAAQMHAVAHQQAHESGRALLNIDDCSLCLAAAAVASGALVGDSPQLALAVPRHAAPQWVASAATPSRPFNAYRSRAPPAIQS